MWSFGHIRVLCLFLVSLENGYDECMYWKCWKRILIAAGRLEINILEMETVEEQGYWMSVKICLGSPPRQKAVGYAAGSKIHPNSEVVLADCLATVTGGRPLGCHLLWKPISLWLLLTQARMPGWFSFKYFTCRANDSVVVTLPSLLSCSRASGEHVRKQVSSLPGAKFTMQISLHLLSRDFGSIIQPLCWWET